MIGIPKFLLVSFLFREALFNNINTLVNAAVYVDFNSSSIKEGDDYLQIRQICPLLCKNGSTCRRKATTKNLFHLIQLGHTVDSCEPCPSNFAGIACDIPIINNDHNKTCDYAYRYGSQFAGLMCQKPVTEYCTMDGSDYCTNGGKCTKDFDTSRHKDWNFEQGQVCACPREFYGPHCEWLKSAIPAEQQVTQKNDERKSRTGMVVSTYIIVLIIIGSIGTILWFRRHHRSEYTRTD